MENLYQNYIKERDNLNVPAKYALAFARIKATAIPSNVDGFDISWKVEEDDFLPDEEYGSFTNAWQPGAIQNYPRDRHAYKWFIPEYPIAERIETLNNKYWGMSKQNAFVEANKAAREAMHKAKEAQPCYVVVNASKKGIVLGKSTIAGIDNVAFEENEVYKKEILLDLIPEAVSDAKSALEQLCGCK